MSFVGTLWDTLYRFVYGEEQSRKRVLFLSEINKDEDPTFETDVRSVSVADETITLRVSGWHKDGAPTVDDWILLEPEDGICKGTVYGIFRFTEVEPAGLTNHYHAIAVKKKRHT